MDFGDILNQWEKGPRKEKKITPANKEKNKGSFDDLVDQYLPAEVKEADLPREERGPGRKALKRMEPQDTLDLHGLTVKEAQKATLAFLRSAQSRGFRKVLIIHGKGFHSSESEGILRKGIRRYLQTCPLAGETGSPPRSLGGEGAVWVIVRRKK